MSDNQSYMPAMSDMWDEDEWKVPVYETAAERELLELRTIANSHPHLFKSFYEKEAAEALARTVMFGRMSEAHRRELAKVMKRRVYQPHEMIAAEGRKVSNAFIISSGEVRRWKANDDKKALVHTVCHNSIGTLHLYDEFHARFNAECLTEVVAYELERQDFLRVIAKNPEMYGDIIGALCAHIRRQSKSFRTPLLEQQSHKTSYTATAIGAAIESFYRSAMNSVINQKLTGQSSKLFPHMHIQLPTRVGYIVGIKQIRSSLQQVDIKENDFFAAYPTFTRVIMAVFPGIAMCPMSSILEASNAGHMNPEPMTVRWVRGFAPRLVREVIFGIGINQLSDYYVERVPSAITNEPLRHALGSISAGLMAGYLSHIPHNISTMRLIAPDKSYSELWRELVGRYENKMPSDMAPGTRRLSANLLTIFAPIGCLVRSAQIAGTFGIINGALYACRNQNWY